MYVSYMTWGSLCSSVFSSLQSATCTCGPASILLCTCTVLSTGTVLQAPSARCLRILECKYTGVRILEHTSISVCMHTCMHRGCSVFSYLRMRLAKGGLDAHLKSMFLLLKILQQLTSCFVTRSMRQLSKENAVKSSPSSGLTCWIPAKS